MMKEKEKVILFLRDYTTSLQLFNLESYKSACQGLDTRQSQHQERTLITIKTQDLVFEDFHSHKPKMWSFEPNMAALNCLVFKSLPSRAEPKRSSHCVGLGLSLSSTHSEVMSISSN